MCTPIPVFLVNEFADGEADSVVWRGYLERIPPPGARISVEGSEVVWEVAAPGTWRLLDRSGSARAAPKSVTLPVFRVLV